MTRHVGGPERSLGPWGHPDETWTATCWTHSWRGPVRTGRTAHQTARDDWAAHRAGDDL